MLIYIENIEYGKKLNIESERLVSWKNIETQLISWKR